MCLKCSVRTIFQMLKKVSFVLRFFICRLANFLFFSQFLTNQIFFFSLCCCRLSSQLVSVCNMLVFLLLDSHFISSICLFLLLVCWSSVFCEKLSRVVMVQVFLCLWKHKTSFYWLKVSVIKSHLENQFILKFCMIYFSLRQIYCVYKLMLQKDRSMCVCVSVVVVQQ